MSENKFKFPTEEVELPSRGLLYPKDHPLKSGKIEMKYMTAKEEDILTNQNYIAKGIVLDKLLQSLIITDVKLSNSSFLAFFYSFLSEGKEPYILRVSAVF